MDVIDVLIEDHRKAQELFEALGINVGDRTALARQLAQELRQHTSAEEEAVYPAMRRALPDLSNRIDEGIEEHHQVEQLLMRLDGMSAGDTGFDDLVGEIRDDVMHHVEEEETEVLPRFREQSSEEERAEIGRRVMATKQGGGPIPMPPVASQVSGRAEVSMDMSKDELYERAKDADIEGRSKMTKEQLVRALNR